MMHTAADLLAALNQQRDTQANQRLAALIAAHQEFPASSSDTGTGQHPQGR